MALTFTPQLDPIDVWGKTEVRFYNAVPAATDYALGGYTISPGSVGLRTIKVVKVTSGSLGTVFTWNAATAKLQAFVMPVAATAGPLNEAPAASDFSALTLGLEILGN